MVEENSSKTSSESNSAEESPAHAQEAPQQPAFTESGTPTAGEEEAPPGDITLLPSIDATEPSVVIMLSATALPDPETSTDRDALLLIPNDATQTALGSNVTQSDPDSQPSVYDTQHILPDTQVTQLPEFMGTDIISGPDGTDQPQVTTLTTYQGFSRGATPPFPAHILESTPPPSYTAPTLQIPISYALTGVPVCLSLQLMSPEPQPPRGDNVWDSAEI